MRVVFVGVGEAFDEKLPNCSALIRSGSGAKESSILLDCGFTAPFSYWRVVERPMELDAVWISHFHGDHYFGLPALLLRFWEEGRTRPLDICGQPGVEDRTWRALDAAYGGVRERLAFDVAFHEVAAGQQAEVAGFSLATARSEHPEPNCSLRLSDGSSAIFYSGDGRATSATRELAQGVELVVHESFTLEPEATGHGTVPGSIEFGRQAGAPFTALVHLRRDVRHGRIDEVRQLMDEACAPGLLLPQPGDSLELTP